MATLDHDCDIVEKVMFEIARDYPSRPPVRTIATFDRKHGQFLLMHEGWQGYRRVYGILAHVEVADGKICIHEDGYEDGLANLFVAAGIPKDRIVLAMDAPSMRAAGEFAAA